MLNIKAYATMEPILNGGPRELKYIIYIYMSITYVYWHAIFSQLFC
jgi:hypothetical protein